MISWILNIDIILDNTTFDFRRNFLNCIIVQSNHLRKNIGFEKDYLKKIEILTAIILSGLAFKEYQENFQIGVKELEILVKNSFDNNGFPLSRNPNDLIFLSKYLIFCKEVIKGSQKYVPEFLDTIIDKNIVCIKNILTPNNSIPLFNGGIEENLEDFNKFIDELEYKSKNIKGIIGGIHILNIKNNLIFFDSGEPPKKGFSKSYQSGPLSFEYYLDGKKIITNCGFGNNISSKAELLSRFTSAQSTLTLNDTSVTKFERNRIINKVFGNSIKNSFKVSNIDRIDNNDYTKLIASHNG